jgi:hypothetical protein
MSNPRLPVPADVIEWLFDKPCANPLLAPMHLIEWARVAGRGMETVLAAGNHFVAPGTPEPYRNTCGDRAYCG